MTKSTSDNVKEAIAPQPDAYKGKATGYRGKYPFRIREFWARNDRSPAVHCAKANNADIVELSGKELRALQNAGKVGTVSASQMLGKDIRDLFVALSDLRAIKAPEWQEGETRVFIITASLATDNGRFGCKGARFKVTRRDGRRDSPRFYAVASGYGCSRDYPTAESAIRGMLRDHACTLVSIRADMTGKIASEVVRLTEFLESRFAETDPATVSGKARMSDEGLTSWSIAQTLGANCDEVLKSVERDERIDCEQVLTATGHDPHFGKVHPACASSIAETISARGPITKAGCHVFAVTLRTVMFGYPGSDEKLQEAERTHSDTVARCKDPARQSRIDDEAVSCNQSLEAPRSRISEMVSETQPATVAEDIEKAGRWYITVNGYPLCLWTSHQAGRDDARSALALRQPGITTSCDCCSFTDYAEACAVLLSWCQAGKNAKLVGGECPALAKAAQDEAEIILCAGAFDGDQPKLWVAGEGAPFPSEWRKAAQSAGATPPTGQADDGKDWESNYVAKDDLDSIVNLTKHGNGFMRFKKGVYRSGALINENLICVCQTRGDAIQVFNALCQSRGIKYRSKAKGE